IGNIKRAVRCTMRRCRVVEWLAPSRSIRLSKHTAHLAVSVKNNDLVPIHIRHVHQPISVSRGVVWAARLVKHPLCLELSLRRKNKNMRSLTPQGSDTAVRQSEDVT